METEPHWMTFFGRVADGIIRQLAPRTTLDVGCATGFLVAALAQRGVEAEGTDISEFAVEEAVSGAKGRLRVQSLTEPLRGTWDLITCIEVLEHMPEEDVDLAIENICNSTDKILFSSTPHDFDEASHVSVKPVAKWVELFGERGFFRRTDLDLSYLSPWALVVERRSLSPAQVAYDYESELQPLREEVLAKRSELLNANRRIVELEERLHEGGGLLHDDDPEFASPERVVTLIDQVVGLQAELAEERYQHDHMLRNFIADTDRNVESLELRARSSEQRVEEVLSSRSWRLGQLIARPLRSLHLMLRHKGD